jgi:hypothetical protein
MKSHGPKPKGWGRRRAIPNGTLVVVPKDRFGVAGPKDEKFIIITGYPPPPVFQANGWVIRQAHIRKVRAPAS